MVSPTIVYYVFAKRTLRENVQIWSFLWSVFSLIQSKYGKMRTRKNSAFEHFLRIESSEDFNLLTPVD